MAKTTKKPTASKNRVKAAPKVRPLDHHATGFGDEEPTAFTATPRQVAARKRERGREALRAAIRAQLVEGAAVVDPVAPSGGLLGDLRRQNAEVLTAVEAVHTELRRLADAGGLDLPWAQVGAALQPSPLWAASVALLAVDFRARVERGQPNKGFRLFLAGLRDLTELERLDAVRAARQAAKPEDAPLGPPVDGIHQRTGSPGTLSPVVGDAVTFADGGGGVVTQVIGDGPTALFRVQIQDGSEVARPEDIATVTRTGRAR